MNWVQVLVAGAIGGLVAGAMAPILKAIRGGKADQRWHWWAYFIILALALALGRVLVAPPIERWYAATQVEEGIAKLPLFRTLQQYEPALYGQLVKVMQDEVRKGVDVAVAQAAVRSQIGPIIQKRLAVAQDEAVLNYMQVNMIEVKELMASGDEACYTFLFPHLGAPFNIQHRIKKETQEADVLWLTKVIESASVAPQKPVRVEDVQMDLVPVYSNLAVRFGDELKRFDEPQTSLAGKRKVCEMTIALYADLFALTPPKAGRVLRAMMGSTT